MCPSREPPPCVPASRRYRTHDGTCNNRKRPRWGAAQMPFHRFLAPEYADGVEGIRRSILGSLLPSARFVSLVVHGTRHEEAPVTMMLALWGQLLDHDLTATAQPRSLNGSTPRCCGKNDDALHPSCLPIKVPLDDPWLSPLGVRCLEFLRSAPAQRRDCLLSWREQTNQVTSYIDASPIYSSNPRTSDNARIFRSGMLLFGRGPPSEDVCFRAALANQCIRPGDARSGEQPGLLMLHMVWVNEHNQIATQLSDINPHWSDEKLYQETRRIIGAMFQHITYREFLPIILGKEVCRLFNLELENSGFYKGYDTGVNPTVANEFSAAAFRFGHSLIQGSYMRADRHHRFIPNNVTLHEESADGDLGGPGSLHRLVRGMVNQRALKRDEFITAELTNHLFQTRSFPFGLDLAAINIQRGRDHGIQPYVNWRIPCGLTPIKDWEDLERVMGPASAHRLRKAYRSVDDIDMFVGGLAERPVVGGIVGPTFSCIIAQQFGNLRKGDRFWYENPGFESSFTPAQLESIRQVAFSQVLCRALGGGTLQPHVFLPADIGQNDRLSCDSKLMAPIDLEPWTERDPFTRPNDEPNAGQSDNFVELDTVTQTVFTTTSSTRRPTKKVSNNVVSNVDFIPNANTGLQIPSNGHIVLNSPRPQTTAVNNKLDLNQSTQRPLSISHSTSSRPVPQKEPTQTASTAIDNKLDLTATTVPPKRKPTRKTTPKRRPTAPNNLIQNNVDFVLKRDASGNATEDTTRHRRDLTFVSLSKLFTKEDNVTLPRKNSALRRGYYPAPEPPSDYDDVNNYDYNGDGDQPVYVKPGYGYDSGYEPPTEPPPPPNPYYYGTTEEPPPEPPQPPYCVYNCYNPYGLDTRKPPRATTPKRGLPTRIVNNDYDPQNKRRTTRQPTHQQLQQQRTTTSRTVILRPGLVVINDNRPNDKPIFLSSSSSSASISASSPTFNSDAFHQSSKNPSSSSSAASQSVFSVETRPQFSSRPITHQQQQSIPSPIFSQKKPNHKKPLKELRTGHDQLPPKLISPLKHDYDYDLIPDHEGQDTSNIHEHDGYLRPEQNKYVPLKKTSDLETYRNYSLYNDEKRRQTAAPYEIPTGRTLWTDVYPGRYAANYLQTLPTNDDDNMDQFVGPYIDQDKTPPKQLKTPFSSTDAALRRTTDNEVLPNVRVTSKVDLTELDTHNVDENDRTWKPTVDVTHKQDSNADLYDRLNGTNQDDATKTIDKNRHDIDRGDMSDNTNETPDAKTNTTEQSLQTKQETNDTSDPTNDNLTHSDNSNSTADHKDEDDQQNTANKTETTADEQDFTSATHNEQTTDSLSNSLHTSSLDILSDDDALLQNFPDTHARTRTNQEPILALDDATIDGNDDNDPRKLARFDQDQTDKQTSATSPTTTTERRPPNEHRTTHGPRRRKPTKSKRPTTGHHHQQSTLTTTHGQHGNRRQPGIALVPFVLLTSIERPDNWVMINVAKSKKRNPLPEVPQLKSEVFSLSELPKPISEED